MPTFKSHLTLQQLFPSSDKLFQSNSNLKQVLHEKNDVALPIQIFSFGNTEEERAKGRKLLARYYKDIEWMAASLTILCQALEDLDDNKQKQLCLDATVRLSYAAALLHFFYEELHYSPQGSAKYLKLFEKSNQLGSSVTKIMFGKNKDSFSVKLKQASRKTLVDTKAGRAWINWGNAWRLFSVRILRVLVLYNQLYGKHPLFRATVGPILNWVAFLAFAPRLLINVTLMLKHMVAHWKMPENEKALGFSFRAGLQFDRRRFEVLNDFIWFADGLAVFLINKTMPKVSATPLAFFLIAGLYFFDWWNAQLDVNEARNRKASLLNGVTKNTPYHRVLEAYSDDQVARKVFARDTAAVFALLMSPMFVLGAHALKTGSVAFISSSLGLSILSGSAGLMVLATIYQRAYQWRWPKEVDVKQLGLFGESEENKLFASSPEETVNNS